MNTETIENQIDDIINECTNYRFASELQYATNDERKENLRAILKIKEGKPIIEKENARTKLNKIYDEIDKNALKKNWAKLSNVQKQNRIKEFVERSVKDKNQGKKLEAKLLKMLTDGKLKRTYVEYDPVAGIINLINIPEKINNKISKVESDSESNSTDSNSDSESDS